MYLKSKVETKGYSEKLLEVKRIYERVMVPRKNIIYGIQPINHREGDESESQFSNERIRSIFKNLKTYGIAIIPPITLVIFRGTPVIVDGHHRYRAIGKYNAWLRQNGEEEITHIPVDILDYEDYKKVMQLDESNSDDMFLYLVECAAISFISLIEQTKTDLEKPLIMPVLPFRENIGIGNDEQ